MNKKRAKDYDADVDDSDSAHSVDSTGKRKSFRRLITRFAEKTSMQGVPYINNAKLLGAKIVWSFMLLCAMAALGVHLWYLFTQYYDWPKQTKVELGYANLRFPDVTICNTNPIHKGRFDELTDVKELKKLIHDLNPRNLVPDQFNADYNPLADNNNNNNQPPPNNDPINQPTTAEMPNNQPTNGNIPNTQTQGTTQITTPQATSAQQSQTPIYQAQNTSRPPRTGTPPTGQPPQVRKKRFVDQYNGLNLTEYNEDFNGKGDDDQVLGEDEYDGEKSTSADIKELFEELYMDLVKNRRAAIGHNITDMLLSCTFNGRDCDSRLFRLYQTSEYGNCWVLTSNKLNVQNSGPEGGLSLILYLEVQEYLKGLTTGYGLRIQIHEPSTFPYPTEEGLFIPSSMETDIGLKMTFIERISGKYGSCEDGDSFTGEYRRKYTRRACQRTCEMLKVINTCGCFADEHEELATRGNNTVRPCRSSQEKSCEAREKRTFDIKASDCNCPNPCQEIQYTKALSSRQWPNDDYAMVLLQSICATNKQVCATLRNDISDQRVINNNFLKLNIYYEDLNFQNITEEPEIALAQFLSDVGGAVGLWIGLSILSFCEVIQLMVELCDYFYHRTMKRRRRDKRRASQKMQSHHDHTSQSKDSDKHSNNKHGSDKHPVNGSPRSSPRFTNLAPSGKPLGRPSPRFDRRPMHINDNRGYDSDNSRHGSPETRQRSKDAGRGLRYDEDYLRRNYMTEY